MVLAELAGVVAEIAQEPCERRCAGAQVGWAPRELRRDHAGAQRMHSCEERIASRRAALLGVVVGELRAFLPNAVDVRGFPNHQALVIDARLHPTDVVAHDEQDIGLLLRLLCRCWHARHRDGDKRQGRGDKEIARDAHGWTLPANPPAIPSQPTPSYSPASCKIRQRGSSRATMRARCQSYCNTAGCLLIRSARATTLLQTLPCVTFS